MTFAEAFRWQAFDPKNRGNLDGLPAPEQFTPKEEAELKAMRQEYPELGQWGLLALNEAWLIYSQDIKHTGWAQPSGRDPSFLGFLLLHSRTPSVAPHDGDGYDLYKIFMDWQSSVSEEELIQVPDRE
jgi:hypothetical protein